MEEPGEKALDQASEELIEAVRASRPGAWEQLVARFQRLVLAVPVELGMPAEDCEEVFQATWVSLYQQIPSLRRPGSLAAWILTTAQRQAWRIQRRRSRERSLSAADRPPPEAPPDPLEQSLELERRELVHAALAELDPRCRTLLSRLFLSAEPPSYARLAEELGLPLGSLGPTRTRCLAELARRLARRGLGE